jgi:hypothetical protein
VQVQEHKLEDGTFLSLANRSRPQIRPEDGYLLNGLIFDKSEHDIGHQNLENQQ